MVQLIIIKLYSYLRQLQDLRATPILYVAFFLFLCLRLSQDRHSLKNFRRSYLEITSVTCIFQNTLYSAQKMF